MKKSGTFTIIRAPIKYLRQDNNLHAAQPASLPGRSLDNTNRINENRVYLCGISMGGSGTLGIGMRHGDTFAAVKANVPAGIEHVSDRMYFPPRTVPASTMSQRERPRKSAGPDNRE